MSRDWAGTSLGLALCLGGVAGGAGAAPGPGCPGNGEVAQQVESLRQEFRQAMAAQERRLRELEAALLRLSPPEPRTEAARPAPVPPPTPTAPPPSRASLSVCAQGCDARDLQSAVRQAAPGGEIRVAAETHGDCAVLDKPLVLKGLRGADGRRAHLAGGVCMGKAPLVTTAANIVIEGFEITGAEVEDGNGACVRLDPGTRDLTIRDIHCHVVQDGLLGQVGGRLTVEDSTFIGDRGGQTHGKFGHGFYVWGDAALIRRTRILSIQHQGHTLKTGLGQLTVEDSVLAALDGHNSRAIDAYGGGNLVVRRSVIQQGPHSDNNDMIGLGLEPGRMLAGGHSLTLEDNWVVFDAGGRWRKSLLRGRELGPIALVGNRLVGVDAPGLDAVREIGDHWFDDRQKAGLPPFDGSLESLPKPGGAL